MILPTPSFHHPIQGTNKNSTQQPQNIALSDLSSNQPNFKSNTLPIKHNTADFTRFRIMWKQLLSSTSTSWAEFVASEPNDLFGTTTALVTGIYYWLYEESNETPSSTPGFFSSWQDMFAGNTNRRRRSSQTPSFFNRETGSESQNLLLDEDEEDALEINNNQVFEAVTARASTEMNRSANEDVAITEDNEFLLG